MGVLGVSSWAADTLAEGVTTPTINSNTTVWETSAGHLESIDSNQFAYVDFAAASEFWGAHLNRHESNNVIAFDAATIFSFQDSNGDAVAEIRTTTAETYQIWTRSGGTLTLRATSAVQGTIGIPTHRYDVHVNIGVSGGVEVFLNGASVVSWSGDTADGGTYLSCVRMITRCEVYSSTAYGMAWALVTDDDSRTYHVQQIVPTGAGSNSDFTGDYLSVDDIRTATPYTDLISSASVGDKFSANCTDPLTAYATGYEVAGVQVTARARAGSGNPRIKPLIRHGGVDATGDSAALNSIDSAAKHLFTASPSTGVAFTYSELASIEIGCEIAAPV